MDGIFSNEISNTLQMFTFPLEVVGLTLAAIEVRFPALAAKIHLYLVDSLERQERDISRGVIDVLINPEEIEEGGRTRYHVLMIIMLLMFLILIGQGIWELYLGEYEGFAAAVGLVFATIFSVFLIAYFTRFIVKWVPDRSVGTLGIIIAGCGVLGEAYQFTIQLQTPSSGCIMGNCDTGIGLFAENSGGKYIGNHIDGVRIGQGTYYSSSNEWYYEGSFVDGEGRIGTTYFSDGDFYRGENKSGLINGWGVRYYSESETRYEGQWQDGTYDGMGAIYNESNQVIEQGIYNNNRLLREFTTDEKERFLEQASANRLEAE